MVKFFDIESFLIIFKSRLESNELETLHIATRLDCTVRHVQKWAINNNVDFINKGGRKYYLWNEAKIREFAAYYNRKHTKPKKPKKQYYIPRWNDAVQLVKAKLGLKKSEYIKTDNRFFRKIFDKILNRHGDWITDEYFVLEIANGNQNLLNYIQYFYDNYEQRGVGDTFVNLKGDKLTELELLSKVFDEIYYVPLPKTKLNEFIENHLEDKEGSMEHKRISIHKLFASYLKERGFSLEVDEEIINKALTDSVKFADYVKENYVPPATEIKA